MADIPNALKYSKDGDHSPEAPNLRFDDRQISKIQSLAGQKSSSEQWKTRLDILLAARKQGNLRDHVRDTFLCVCPYDDLVNELRQETQGFPEKALSFPDSSKQKRAGKKSRKAALKNEQQQSV